MWGAATVNVGSSKTGSASVCAVRQSASDQGDLRAFAAMAVGVGSKIQGVFEARATTVVSVEFDTTARA